MILDTFPTAEEFYKTYWCKKPFIVRGHIPADAFDDFIDGDTMAGLALEDDIKSRFITNNADGKGWQCQHGPLDDDHFDDVGDKNWSLMVQNVEQYHPDTAQLLPYFQLSPRWLLDDIMVSFSTAGGSVGPHTDSYHTFLVQGIGKRTWKISADRIDDDRYVDNPYLEENDHLNKRYFGENLDEKSAGFLIGQSNQNKIQSDLISTIQSDDFAKWMAGYFAMPTIDDVEGADDILSRAEQSKTAITTLDNGDFYLSVDGQTQTVPSSQSELIKKLNSGG